MPQHRQFKKSLRQEANVQLRNRAVKSRLNSSLKKVRTAASKEEASTALRDAVSIIDSSARKGIIKKKTAARKKSGLYKAVAKME
ncbi:MAG: 30S ribosomal protein S20 [Candidatus Latescibacteria bacterium]|nr:30S ribosomal protein S20 [Candidatus Latescibacterota bacterium]